MLLPLSKALMKMSKPNSLERGRAFEREVDIQWKSSDVSPKECTGGDKSSARAVEMQRMDAGRHQGITGNAVFLLL